jgi:hypothetical protein
VIGLLCVRALDRLPHLLLTLVVWVDRECHELVKRHAVLGIDVEQLRRDGGKPQPLLHNLYADEERGRDLLLAHALLAQREEAAELIKGMKWRALNVLGERILLRDPLRTHNTRNWRGASKALLLHEELKRAISRPAGRDFEHAGLGAALVQDRADGKALEERAARDVRREFLDPDARLDAADIGLTQHQPIEWMSRDWLSAIF